VEPIALYLLILSVGLFVYNYFVYPLCMIFLSEIYKKNEIIPDDCDFGVLPKVSFIVAAYNEEKVIYKKLENTLSLNYPSDLIEIIVVSDGSDDNTMKIVEEFANGVINMHEPERRGKSAAINRAVERATGDVIILSDANNDFNTDSILSLVSFFSDESVGAVTGSKHIYSSLDRESSAGDGLYWKYESAIKYAESVLGSITAAEGEILAVRKELFTPINEKLINDDAAITFSIIKAGYRVLYDKNAKSFEQASTNLLDDYHVKVRMTTGGYQTISREFGYLFPPTNWFSFNFISHKILRWLAPHFLITMFICSTILVENIYISIFLLLQILFYMISLFGWLNVKNKKLPSLVYIPMYFTYMNMALFHGFIRYIKGHSNVNWRKADR